VRHLGAGDRISRSSERFGEAPPPKGADINMDPDTPTLAGSCIGNRADRQQLKLYYFGR
jgi:hypothetical protein